MLAYVRMARLCRFISGDQLLQRYPEITRVLDVPGCEDTLARGQYTHLMNRHGNGVTEVMEKALQTAKDRKPDSLLALYAADDWVPLQSTACHGREDHPPEILIELDETRRLARIGGSLLLDKTSFQTLETLAKQHLRGLGEGRASEEFPTLKNAQLLALWDLAEEGTVRRRVTDLRRKLEAGLGAEAAEIVENLPWHGYRLAPDRVIVRKADLCLPTKVRTASS